MKIKSKLHMPQQLQANSAMITRFNKNLQGKTVVKQTEKKAIEKLNFKVIKPIRENIISILALQKVEIELKSTTIEIVAAVQ